MPQRCRGGVAIPRRSCSTKYEAAVGFAVPSFRALMKCLRIEWTENNRLRGDSLRNGRGQERKIGKDEMVVVRLFIMN